MILDKHEIKKIIPYQEPFLFLDGVQEISENKIFGFYQTSPDDYYFKGHFTDLKIMPGVLVVEALAQLATVLLRKKIENHQDYHFLAYEVRNVRFLKPIFPGDKIELEAEVLGIDDLANYKLAKILGKAFVNKDLKCELRALVVILPKKTFEEKYVG